MEYALEDIARTLKEARERKGLSQRALSARSGVRQYQISKIENGTVDLRLSSLIALARALDLDLRLLPRRTVPAVESIVRATTPEAVAAPVRKEIDRTLEAVKHLRTAYPDVSELNKLQNTIQSLRNFQGIGTELDTLRAITKPVRDLQKLHEASKLFAEQSRAQKESEKRTAEQFRAMKDAAKISEEQFRALRKAVTAAQNLRNQLVHSSSETRPQLKPAYRLDEDDNG